VTSQKAGVSTGLKEKRKAVMISREGTKACVAGLEVVTKEDLENVHNKKIMIAASILERERKEPPMSTLNPVMTFLQ